MGGYIELGAIWGGGLSTAICEDTTKLIDMLPEVKPTVLIAVPRIWNRIYDGVQKLMKTKPPVIQKMFERAMTAGNKERRGESPTLGERFSRFMAKRLILPEDHRPFRRQPEIRGVGLGGAVEGGGRVRRQPRHHRLRGLRHDRVLGGGDRQHARGRPHRQRRQGHPGDEDRDRQERRRRRGRDRRES
jgi:hypothetical protein